MYSKTFSFTTIDPNKHDLDVFIRSASRHYAVDDDGRNFLLLALGLKKTPVSAIRDLLNAGACPWQPSMHGQCAAGLAFSTAFGAKAREAGFLEYLMLGKASGNFFWRDADPALPGLFGLHRAAALGLLGEIRRIHAATGNIDRPDAWGYTPLLYAIANGQPEAARLLIELGADRNRPQGSSLASIPNVVMPGFFFNEDAGMELLREFYPKVRRPEEKQASEKEHAQEKMYGIPMHIAARHNNCEAIIRLMRLGVSPVVRSLSGATPLACAMETPESLTSNPSSRLLLKEAVKRGIASDCPHEPPVRLGLANTLKDRLPGMPRRFGHVSPKKIGYAFRQLARNKTSPLDIYLDRGMDPNVRWRDHSLLAQAVLCGNERAVDLLLRYGADPSEFSAQELYGICNAHRRGLKTVEPLLAPVDDELTSQPPADRDVPAPEVAVAAIRRKAPQALREYLLNGGNPNASFNGKALLCHAASGQWAEGIDALVCAGADPELASMIGIAPPHLCEADGLQRRR